jgi:hypothetical protein
VAWATKKKNGAASDLREAKAITCAYRGMKRRKEDERSRAMGGGERGYLAAAGEGALAVSDPPGHRGRVVEERRRLGEEGARAMPQWRVAVRNSASKCASDERLRLSAVLLPGGPLGISHSPTASPSNKPPGNWKAQQAVGNSKPYDVKLLQHDTSNF